MSTTIDERVVQMRFDNSHFEKNVHTSMSTLDKLKQKLKLDDAAKGFENISKHAKKVDLASLGAAADTVGSRFSALEVMGVTALANIANSAVNAGKKLLSALTIEPVTTGFREYELKLDSVKTIMASTGESVQTVNKYLEELNEYSDQTIYSFSDMTQNIGKFTNAGVALEDAVMAIKGISNEAAVSGANANEASRAMYNFAQALSAGYVKLIDWKSIELANMATVEFKQQLLDAAVAAGTLTEASDGMYTTLEGNTLSATQNFNETLQDQWMTTEVLVNTLKDYADETTDIGKKAFAAAQDVTKFTQMLDVLKETAQSGWARTWEIIFGDIEQAKALWTPLTNFFSIIIQGMDNIRNGVLEFIFNKTPMDTLIDKFSGIAEVTETAAETVESFGDIVDSVINGDFGNGLARVQALTDAGYDWAHIQNLVNEKLGDSTRHATEFTDAVEGSGEVIGNTTELIAGLSDEELTNLGLTDREIKAFRKLEEQAEKTGVPIQELMDDMQRPNIPNMLVESFKAVIEQLKKPLEAVKEVWSDIVASFDGSTLTKGVQKIHDMATSFTISEDAISKFKTILEGAWAVIQLVSSTIGSGVVIAFQIFNTVLGALGTDLLSVVALIAEYITKFRDWVKEHTIFIDTAKKLSGAVTAIVEGINKCVDAFLELEVVQNVIKSIKDGVTGFVNSITKAFDSISFGNIGDKLSKVFSDIHSWIQSLNDSSNLGKDIIDGLINGLQAGIGYVVELVTSIGLNILNAIKSVLGIHSPSTEFFTIGSDIIAGLIEGLQNGLSAVIDFFKNLGGMIKDSMSGDGVDFDWSGAFSNFSEKAKILMSSTYEFIKNILGKCVDFIKSIDLGTIMSAIVSGGLLITLKKLTDVIAALAKPLEGLGDIFDGFGDMLTGLGKKFKAQAMEARSEALLNFAKSIAILVAALYVLGNMDRDKLNSAIGSLIILSGIMIALSATTGLLNKKAGSFGKLSLSLIAMSAGLLIMTAVFKTLASIDAEKIPTIIALFREMMVGLGLLLAEMAIIASGNMGASIKQVSSTLTSIAGAMLILAVVAKLIAGMSWSDMGKAAIGLAGLTAFIAILVGIAKTAGKDLDSVGSTLTKIAGAMLILTIVAKLIAGMSWGDMAKAAVGLAGLSGVIALLISIVKIAGKDAPKIGATLLAISGAMLALTLVATLLSAMSWGGMAKALIGLTGLAGIIALLVGIVESVGKDAPKIALTLLAMSVSIGILGGVCMMLSLLSVGAIAKGLTAITMLGLVMAAMIYATRGANECKANLIVMTVAIGVMAAAVAALSFIDGSKLAGATIAMTSLMGMFALMTKVASTAKGSIATLIILTAVVGMLGGIIYVLSTLPIDSVLETATSLSILLLSMSASLAILNMVGATISNALLGVVGLLAMAVPLAAFVGVLYLMQNVQNATANAQALIALATTLTLLLIPLSLVGVLMGATGGLAALGLLALTAMAVPLLAFVGVLAVMNNIQNATTNAALLVALMTAITDVLVKVSILGPLAIMGVTAIAALSGVMIAVGALAVAVGALMEKFPQLESFIDTGMPLLEKLANGIGSIIGNFVSGLATGIMSGLPEIGVYLSQFMVNAMPFITGAKMVDDAVLQGIKTLAIAVAALTAADLIASLGSFLTMGGSFADLGTELSKFMINAMPFIQGASMLNEEMTNGVESLASAILTLTKADLIDGLASFLTGGSSLEDFGKQISKFGPYMKEYADSVAGIDTEAIEASAEAAEALSEVASNLPNSGGWAGAFAGNNDIDDFGKQLKKFGPYMKEYADSVAGINTDAIEASADGAKALSEVAANLPNSGGWAGAFAGNNDIDDFGKQLPAFGKGLKDYSKSVSGLDVNSIEASASAVNTLADMFDNLADLNTSGARALTEGLVQIAQVSVTGFINVFNNASVQASAAISNMMNSIVQAMVGKKANCTQVAVAIITSMLNVIKESKTAFQDGGVYVMTSFQNGVLSQKGPTINSIMTVLKSAVEAAKSGVYSSFWNVGKYAMQGFAAGINENTGIIKSAARTAAKAAESAAKAELGVKSPSRKFMAIGNFVVQGLANGIKNNVSSVTKSAENMAEAVLEATKSYLGINSPSVVFNKEVGRWIAQGIAEGITSDTSAEEAAEKKAQNIIDAFNKKLESYGRKSTIEANQLELWKSGDGKNATLDEKYNKEVEYWSNEASRKTVEQQLHYDKWQQMLSEFKEGSKQEQEALIEYQDSQLALMETLDNLRNAKNEVAAEEIENISRKSDAAANDLELWNMGEGKYASFSERYNKNLEYWTAESARRADAQQIARDKWQKMLNDFGSGSKEEQEAYIEYQESQKSMIESLDAIQSVKDSATENALKSYEDAINIRNTMYELWEKTDGVYADDETIDLNNKSRLSGNLKNLQSQLRTYEILRDEILSKYEADSEEALAACEKVVEIKKEIADTTAEIRAIDDAAVERELDALDNSISLREKEYALSKEEAELMAKSTNQALSENEWDKKYIKVLEGNVRSMNTQLGIQEREYEKAVRLYGKSSEEAKAIWDEILTIKTNIAQTKNEIFGIEEDILERERESLEMQYDLAASNADLQYQIWEKTDGRKATSATKNVARMTMLTQQLASQTNIINLARKKWVDAEKKYGKYSNEAQSEYNDYLREQLELANIQNEITDINESTVERQKIALSDYKDYVEKYKKFYAMNGMSEEELVRDAKLVSGYDENSTVNTIFDRTNEALENIKQSSEYSDMLENFSTLGSSYVDAINDGVTGQVDVIITSILEMIGDCVSSIRDEQSKWVSAGKYLVQGLVNGIRLNFPLANKAVAELTRMMITTAKKNLGINSPSTVFAEFGMYAAAGLAQGLIDNSSLSERAATKLGDNAIDNFRNTIARIAEVVSSDIDTEPTIRPVLDLTNVKSGTATLNAMFSKSQAMSINAEIASRTGGDNQNGANTTSDSGTVYQFTQNNYSPKALSRAEIYRQTKNQFATLKGALT